MGNQEKGEGDGMLKGETTKTQSDVDGSKTDHTKNMKKFAIACLVLQAIFAVMYLLMARYDVSADARHWHHNHLKGIDDPKDKKHIEEDLKLNMEKYPCKLLQI